MKNNIYKKILFLFMAGALLGACVKEVDFSGAFKKKVVVNCILNNVYYEHHDQVTNQTLWNGKTVYRGSTRFSSALNGRQTLYLSYNKTDGDYEVIPDAEALLIDDNTGEIIGKFKKELGPDSNTPLPGRWTLDYSMPYTEDENTVSVDVKYRLEVSVPGEKTIVARTSFRRTIPKKAIIPKEYPQQGWLQTKNLDSPIWLMPETYEVIEAEKDTGSYGTWHYSEKESWLYQVRNTYPLNKTDLFNVGSDKGSHIMAIRLNGEKFDKQELPCGFLFPEITEIEGHDHYLSSNLIVASVSEDYDKYIRSVIIDAIHHNNKDDVFSHLNEDQIYSNIENGLGIFGVQFTACMSNGLRPVVYQY